MTNRHNLTEPHVNTLSRRQRDFLQREQLFLDTAREILRRDGIAHLTMDRIAELTEYAKGTLYKHFTCKEDILCALCLECLQRLANVFEHAGNFPGNSRERVMAIGTAYQLYTLQHPEEFDLLIASRTNNIRQKASPQRVDDMGNADKVVHNQLRAVVNGAIADGKLILPPHVAVDELCFSLWAMSFGVLVLDQAREAAIELQLPPVQQIIFRQISLLLDGYGWKPLSTKFDYLQSFQRILRHMDGQP